MNQPVPKLITSDLDRIIKRDFSNYSREEIVEILSLYKSEYENDSGIRVKIACLKIANGDKYALIKAVDKALFDYRDVLMEAEYPLCYRNIFNKMTNKENQEIYKTDWLQYKKWLDREKEKT